MDPLIPHKKVSAVLDNVVFCEVFVFTACRMCRACVTEAINWFNISDSIFFSVHEKIIDIGSYL